MIDIKHVLKRFQLFNHIMLVEIDLNVNYYDVKMYSNFIKNIFRHKSGNNSIGGLDFLT